ncbi:MAG: peptidoglycan bridge formation glycyltransferase FemA/FemB family protein [Candidatus Saccharimonas sp.]
MKWDDVSLEQWDKLFAGFPEANFLQGCSWGELHEAEGDKVLRRGLFKNDKLVGGYQAIIKNAKRGRYMEVPGGPLIDWTNRLAREQLVGDLKQVGKKKRAVFVRIRPQLVGSDSNISHLLDLGLKKAPFHLHAEHTNVIDLTLGEDELLANMRRQTRYEVRQSAKRGVVVSVSTGESAIREFCELQADTAKRQGFIPSSAQFLTGMANVFGESVKVYRAEADGQVLNMALIIWQGEEADYFEAASTIESRKFPGAYGLLWQAIRDAKASGMKRYNLWGIAYSDNPHHRYAGVTTFKRGFGGTDVTYVPAHDLVLRPVAYLKNWVIETARRKKRRL